MLQHSPYAFDPIGPKQPELNGGLYTGEAFKGPWGNVPIIPDVTVLTQHALKLGNEVVRGADAQFHPNLLRPGNNIPLQINKIQSIGSEYHIGCTENMPHEHTNKRIASYDKTVMSSLAPW